MFESIEEAEEVMTQTPADFSMGLIQDSLRNQMNIIDTVVAYCEDNEIEMEDVIPLLDQSIQDRIRVCGIEERYVTSIKVSKNKLF